MQLPDAIERFGTVRETSRPSPTDTSTRDMNASKPVPPRPGKIKASTKTGAVHSNVRGPAWENVTGEHISALSNRFRGAGGGVSGLGVVGGLDAVASV